MKKSIGAILVLTIFQTTALASNCKMTYFRKSVFENQNHDLPEVRDFSKSISSILKISLGTIEKMDDATLGLFSAVATGGILLYDFKPEMWNRLQIGGHLIYQDMPISGTPLKGAKIFLKEGKNVITTQSGIHGEFSESLTKLIPHTRLRLFSGPMIRIENKSIPILKIPITIQVDSAVCKSELTISETPIEPLVFILSNN